MKNTHTVIQAHFSDSMEDWIFEMCLNDTMKPLFEWSKQYTDVVFKRTIDVQYTHYRIVKVEMEVKDPAIIAHYVLENGSDPIKKLTWTLQDA